MIALVLVTAATLLVVAALVTLGAHIDQRALRHDAKTCSVCDAPSVYPYSPACSVGCSIAMGR